MRKPVLIMAMAVLVALVAVVATVCSRYRVREKPVVEWIYKLDYAFSDRLLEAARQLSPPDEKGSSTPNSELAWVESRRQEAPERALLMARLRIELIGIRDAQVDLIDDNRRLRILLPAMSADQYEKVRFGLRKMGRLSFHWVADKARDREIIRKVLDPDNPQHSYGGYELCNIEHKDPYGPASREAVAIRTVPLVDGSQITHADAESDGKNGWVVNVRLNKTAAARFEQATGENVGRRLAIVLDGVCKSAPRIMERVTGEIRISGSFTKKEALELAAILKCPEFLLVDFVLESEQELKPTK